MISDLGFRRVKKWPKLESNQQGKLIRERKRGKQYANASGGVLTRFKEQSDVAAHLPERGLALVPEQLDPRRGHLRPRLAVPISPN